MAVDELMLQLFIYHLPTTYLVLKHLGDPPDKPEFASYQEFTFMGEPDRK